jgi:hypothetical protein
MPVPQAGRVLGEALRRGGLPAAPFVCFFRAVVLRIA